MKWRINIYYFTQIIYRPANHHCLIFLDKSRYFLSFCPITFLLSCIKICQFSTYISEFKIENVILLTQSISAYRQILIENLGKFLPFVINSIRITNVTRYQISKTYVWNDRFTLYIARCHKLQKMVTNDILKNERKLFRKCIMVYHNS